MKLYLGTIPMELEKASVVPLHQNWKYLDDCCELINEQWPRSTTARKHSLTASKDNFPTSLILLLSESEDSKASVVGHSKISPMHRFPNACFVESVVITKKLRGRGWGRYIMQETEKYIKTKGKSVIYLSTSDKQEFYHKLGYLKCEPVSIYGGKGLEIKNNFSSSLFRPKSWANLDEIKLNSKAPAPPVPPPLPPSHNPNSIVKTYMQKLLF